VTRSSSSKVMTSIKSSDEENTAADSSGESHHCHGAADEACLSTAAETANHLSGSAGSSSSIRPTGHLARVLPLWFMAKESGLQAEIETQWSRKPTCKVVGADPLRGLRSPHNDILTTSCPAVHRGRLNSGARPSYLSLDHLRKDNLIRVRHFKY